MCLEQHFESRKSLVYVKHFDSSARSGGLASGIIKADVASLPSGSSIDTTTGNVALPAGYSFDLTNFYYNGVSTSNPIPSDFLTAASRENILTKDDGSTFGLGAIISRRNENIGIIGRINLAFMRCLYWKNQSSFYALALPGLISSS